MEILQQENEHRGKFFVMLDGKEEALMTYVYAGNNIIIDHTEVHEIFKGQGVGYKLVEEAVAFARTKKIKIKPLCPFAFAVFKKKGEQYADVLLK
jgi:uncharacterized protein